MLTPDVLEHMKKLTGDKYIFTCITLTCLLSKAYLYWPNLTVIIL